MTPAEAFADLKERLENAARTLEGMANDTRALRGHQADQRLRGKAEGVRLALDYLRQYEVSAVRQLGEQP